MTRLFDRTVRAIVGRPGRPGLEIRDHRMSFTVGRTRKKKPASCELEIYNLSRDEAAAFESNARGLSLQLFAGYGPAPTRIFVGEIRRGRARTTMNGPDRITRIEARDGGTRYRSARINKSFGASVTTREVLNELATAFGVRIDLPDDISDLDLVEGYVASGTARDVMEDMARALGFDWFFEDGVLRVTAEGVGTREQAVLLTANTGLVEDIEVTSKGVNGRSLLNPLIRPKRVIQVETATQSGFYLVRRVIHKGDSGWAREFYTEFEARQVNAATGGTR